MRPRALSRPMRNFYPRPPRGGRRCWLRPGTRTHPISIHALREEGDLSSSVSLCRASNFYPRPPRGGRLTLAVCVITHLLFLSTPSARRATRTVIAARTSRTDFYPRPPRGGRLCQLHDLIVVHVISIHALREEGDDVDKARIYEVEDFYPRPPRGGRPASYQRDRRSK